MRVGCVGIEVEHLFQQNRLGGRFLRGTIFFQVPGYQKLGCHPEFLVDLLDFEKKIRDDFFSRTTYTGFVVSIYTFPPYIFLLSFVPSLSFSSLSSLLSFFSLVSSCPPFSFFRFGIIAIIQLHHNRKKAFT